MTHLEDLWNSYPTSEPPTITAPSPVRKVGPLALAGVAAIATAATFVVVTGGSSSPGGHGPAQSTAASAAGQFKYAAFEADLRPARSCDALLATYQQRAMAHVTAYGWDTGGPVPLSSNLAYGNFMLGTVHASAADALGGTGYVKGLDSSAQRAPRMSAQGNSATGTNVQEIGVDEPDSVKTNGTLIARITDNTLAVYDASGATIKARGTLALPYFNSGSILMSDTTVIAAGVDSNPTDAMGGTRIDTISLTDPDHPRLTSSVVYAGGQITTLREQGTIIRLVMASALPQLPFVSSQQGVRSDAQALATNRKLVAKTTLKDWLPTYDSGAGAQQLLPCDRVAVPPAGVPLGTTSIVSFDASAPTGINRVGVAGTLGNAYESQHNLYLTVGGSGGGCYARMCPMYDTSICCYNGGGPGPTTILQFALDGVGITHVATGEVPGSIKDSWSMDEVSGSLRVALTRYTAASQVNELVTMVPRGKHLVVSGRLSGLGRNQTLTAARWFDNLAIISTSDQMDPLYTIDLTDPTHPTELGALHLPGQTVYIHPIATNRFLTISQQTDNANGHAQVALFDTSDLRNVRQLAQVSTGDGTSGLAGYDPRDFTWLPDRETALTSVQGPNGTFLGAYAVGDHTLSGKQITLPTNANDARTFEVANGKVVLVSGGSVTFLSM